MANESEHLAAMAEAARTEGCEEQALPQLEVYLAREPRDVLILHWQALLLRELDRRGEAITALEAARSLAPDDVSIAHSIAKISAEAGRPASHLFLEAIRLAPGRPELRLGLAAARHAEGDGPRALAELDGMLAANPGWYPGHRQYAQLASLIGQGAAAMASYERAIARFPDAGQLYFDAAGLLIEGERYAEALEMVDRAIARVGEDKLFLQLRAGALDELGRSREAETLFARLGPSDEDLSHAIRRQRFLLRRGDATAAAQELEPRFASGAIEGLWPYAALAWRLLGDPRAGWLERDELVAVIDLGPDEIDLAGLIAVLHRLHAGSGRFLDQSVRDGTQTDGALLARIEPEIMQLRTSLARRVADHVASLPAQDSNHPALSLRRDRAIRFAGSWSVRFNDAGYHASHYHPQGWFSSALYIAVPQGLESDEGMLALGESPQDLGLGLPPHRLVEPRPGRLVLFPSTMWHATRPYRAGERMTVAFDIAQP